MIHDGTDIPECTEAEGNVRIPCDSGGSDEGLSGLKAFSRRR